MSCKNKVTPLGVHFSIGFILNTFDVSNLINCKVYQNII